MGWQKSDSINLDDAHFVTIDPEVHSDECSGIYNLDEV